MLIAAAISLSACQDDECYEQSADVRSQLRFFEQLERMEKQRKDEQEREILLKAAKVSCLLTNLLDSAVYVLELFCPCATVCACVLLSERACCSCPGPDRWIRVWHQWMKWPPCVLSGSWPQGSSVLARPPRTQWGEGWYPVQYTRPSQHQTCKASLCYKHWQLRWNRASDGDRQVPYRIYVSQQSSMSHQTAFIDVVSIIEIK